MNKIGIIRSAFKEKFGTPRQPGFCSSIDSIEMIPPYNNPSAFNQLETFSHLWIIFDFHLNEKKFIPAIRPPRLKGEKVGVFATRAPIRPNGLGLSAVTFKGKRKVGSKIFLDFIGGDMVDGTPVIDIKPYIPQYDHLPANSGWVPKSKKSVLNWNVSNQCKKILKDDPEFEILLKESLLQDPRPFYLEEERIFGSKIKNADVRFTIKGNDLTLTEIEFI